ncbi:RHS repeat-associated core domain-containing protein [Myxococcus landrumensis]|uniref:RHS repeat-associated core domain-containing protein n=1 Tax=Myxococcus landrumensis TaxID=2813577 RepID=UPI001F5081A8|nr:RHS repeat-associated core domain-containing protein [Myxococcus landrumus]
MSSKCALLWLMLLGGMSALADDGVSGWLDVSARKELVSPVDGGRLESRQDRDSERNNQTRAYEEARAQWEASRDVAQIQFMEALAKAELALVRQPSWWERFWRLPWPTDAERAALEQSREALLSAESSLKALRLKREDERARREQAQEALTELVEGLTADMRGGYARAWRMVWGDSPSEALQGLRAKALLWQSGLAVEDVSQVARIEKIVATDLQEGVVGQPLPQPVTVRVTTATGEPVLGATVTFKGQSPSQPRFLPVMGSATPQAQLAVLTDENGLASVRVLPDTYILRYWFERQATPHNLRLGYNMVTAETSNGTELFRLPSPFVHAGLPDAPAQVGRLANVSAIQEPGIQLVSPLFGQVLDQYGNACANKKVVWTQAATTGRFFRFQDVMTTQVLDPSNPMQLSSIEEWSDTSGWIGPGYIPGPSTGYYYVTMTVGSLSRTVWINANSTLRYTFRTTSNDDFNGAYLTSSPKLKAVQVLRWPQNAPGWVPLTGNEADLADVAVGIWTLSTAGETLGFVEAVPSTIGTEPGDDDKTVIFRQRFLAQNAAQEVYLKAIAVERRANGQLVQVCCARDLYSWNSSTIPTLELQRRLTGGGSIPPRGMALTSDSAMAFWARNQTSDQIYARVTVQPQVPGDGVLSPSGNPRDADNDLIMPEFANAERILPLLAGTKGGRVRFELYAKDYSTSPPTKVRQAVEDVEILHPSEDIVLSGLPLGAQWMLPAWDFVSSLKPEPGQPPPDDAQTPVAYPARLGVKVFTPGRLVVSRGGTELASATVRTGATGITEVVPLSGAVLLGLDGFATVDVPPGSVGTEDIRVSLVPENPVQETFHEDVPLTTRVGSVGKLPVAHTFVKGVSVVDGHLVKQAADVELPSRGLGLAWTRTYASGISEEGLLGAGWTHGYEGAVLPAGGGFRYVVTGGEGSGHTFQCTEEGVGCVPQRGFHGTLRVEGAGAGREFIFRAKSGVEYRHGRLDTAVYPARYRLTSIVAPAGHKVSLRYGDASLDGALTRVHDGASGRLLQLSYQREAGRLRLHRVELHHATNVDATTLTPLGVCIQYGYDSQRRLSSVARYDGACGSGAPVRTEAYSYENGASELGRTRMSQHIGPDGQVIRYTYHGASETIPGEDAYLLLVDKDARVKSVVETLSLQPLQEATTTFAYSIAPESRTVLGQSFTTFATEVKGPRPEVPATRYRMLPTGAVAELERPLSAGVVARTAALWDAVHRTRVTEEDARGRITRFSHDAKGNLVARRISGGALPAVGAVAATVPVTDAQGQSVAEVVEKWGYDAGFNTQTCHVDAEGYATVSRVDSTGDAPEALLPFGTGRVLETRHYASRVSRQVLTSTGTCEQAVASLATSPQDVVLQWKYCGVESTTPCPQGALTGDWVETVGADGHVETATGYDIYGQLLSKTLQVQGATTVASQYTYDARGRLLTEQDGLGRQRVQEWDALDRVKKEVRNTSQGLGVTRTLEYSAGGHLKREVVGGDFVREHTLDAAGRRVRTVESGGRLTGALETRFTYDEVGNPTSVLDRRGVRMSTVYDFADRPVEVIASVGDGPRFTSQGGSTDEVGRVRTVSRVGYDAVGNKVWESDLSGFDRTCRMDSLYRVVEEQGPEVPGATDGSSSLRYAQTFAYDLRGLRVRQVDGNGHPSTMEYDLLGRAVVLTDANGGVERRRHDGRGNVTETRWEVGGVQHRMQSATYDGLGRVFSTTETVAKASGQHVYTTQTVHDDVAHVEWTRDARGFLRARHFDGLGRVFKVVVDAASGPLARQPDVAGAGPALGLTSTVEFDKYGQVAANVDALGRRTETVHDALGRPQQVNRPMGVVESQVHDGEGRVIQSVDGRGVERRFTFDALGRPRDEVLVESISRSGQLLTVSQRVYVDSPDVEKLVREELRDARENLSEVYRDGLRREVRRVDAQGNASEVRFDALHKRQEKNPKGHVTRFFQDAVGRPLSQTEHLSSGGAAVYTQSWTYDDASRSQTHVDRRGVPTVDASDGLGRKVRSVRGQGLEVAEQSWVHDAAGQVVRTVDANGHATVRLFDGAGRMLEETLGEGTVDAATTTFQYDAGGQLAQQKGPRATGASFDARFSYDDLGRRVREENALGQVTVRAFDASGNKVCEKRPLGQPTLGHGGATGLTLAQMESHACAGTYVTKYAYDELGKLLTVTDAAGGLYSYVYDATRNLVAKQDANGNLTTYEYDARNLRTAEHPHLDGHARLTPAQRASVPLFETGATPSGVIGTLTSRFTYDENGNLATRLDPKGQLTTLAHGLLDRLGSRSYSQHALPRVFPSVDSESITYDGNGNVSRETQHKSTASGPQSEVTSYTHDALDRVKTRLREHDGKKLTYAYDAMGHRTSVEDADGVTTTYSYDALGRLTHATLPAGMVQYSYWPDSLPKGVVWPNGVSEGRCYDDAGRLSQLVVALGSVSSTCQPSGVAISRYAYAYDSNGNRLSQIEARTAPQTQVLGADELTTYGHDVLDRLTGVASPDGVTSLYGLDAVGNRIGERQVPSSMAGGIGLGPDAYQGASQLQLTRDVMATFNRVDWLRELVDAKDASRNATLDYDLAGNLVQRTMQSGTRALSWDIRQTLTAVFDNGLEVGRYDYDIGLQRTQRKTSSENVVYILDEDFVLQEADGAQSSHPARRRYHYGAGPLAVTEISAQPSSSFLTSDALGSVADAMSTSVGGGVTAVRQYDAWGNHRAGSAPTAGAFKLGFTGHQHDVETGLTYARARYYDSELGRFISRDSFEGNLDDAPSLHRYVYALVNPLRYFDVSGYCAEGVDEGCRLSFLEGAQLFGRGVWDSIGRPLSEVEAENAKWRAARLEANYQAYQQEHEARVQAGPSVAERVVTTVGRAYSSATEWVGTAVRNVPGVRRAEEVVVEAADDLAQAHDRFTGEVASSMSPYSLRARAHPEEGLYVGLGAETDKRAQETVGPALREGYQAAAQAAVVARGALKSLDEVGAKVGTKTGREATKDLIPSGEQKTLSLSGKWEETKWLPGHDGIVYVLRDSHSGEILKVGKTTVDKFEGRFDPYVRAGRRTGRELEVDAWTVSRNSGRTVQSIEGEVRQHLEAQGHAMPWDNSNGRLGRPGPGVPGVYQRTTAKKGYHWDGVEYVKKE